MGNLAVNLEGTTIGVFTVNDKWGYGTNLGAEATVGVSCSITISWSGFPPLNGNYMKNHVYVVQ